MTREPSETTRQRNRRKRRRIKQIKAIATLLVYLAVTAAIVFFAVKGITHLMADSGGESTENPIGNAGVVESGETDDSESSEEAVNSENNEEAINSESNEEAVSSDSSEEAVSSESEENSEQQTSTTPVGEKPEQSWATMLVNKWSVMPEGYVPQVRRVYNCGADTGKDFDVRAADALEQMLADARDAGYNMYLVSAYRTYDYQVGLFNRKLNEYKALGYDDETAYNEASQWVAIPGTSEHCIGLAADIVSSTWYNYNSDLTHDFEETEHFEWLYEHCADYGFILRFPKGDEAVTGITYEPWHYRFVGLEAARYIMDNHITLEEFCAEETAAE